MSKEADATQTTDDAPDGASARADWHPYSVWRDSIRPDEDRDAEKAKQNIELTGSWKPLSVWKKQIKRD